MLVTEFVLKDPSALTVTRAQSKSGKPCIPYDLFHNVPLGGEDWGKILAVFPGLPQSDDVVIILVVCASKPDLTETFEDINRQGKTGLRDVSSRPSSKSCKNQHTGW